MSLRFPDSDVIPAEHLGTDRQKEIVGNIQQVLKSNDVKCSMVTTETFYHEVFAAGPAAESPEIREYSAFRVRNTVDAEIETALAEVSDITRLRLETLVKA